MKTRRDFLIAATAAASFAALRAWPQTPAPRLRIQRLSWAGVKLVSGDATLFIDASYDASSAGTASPDVALSAETRERAAMVTHHHGDHFDAGALRGLLGDANLLIVPESVLPWADARPFRVQPARLYEPVIWPRGSGIFSAICVPAADGLGHPQVSWIVDVAGKRIFHGGDTAWHGHWWDIARAYGPFDTAFLPVNGFRQVVGRYTDSGVPMSLTPEQAAAAAQILHARLAIPIHYGNNNPGYHEIADAAKLFVAAARTRGIEAKIMAPGEWIEP